MSLTEEWRAPRGDDETGYGGWFVRARNGVYEVRRERGAIGEHWVKCDSYVDAVMVRDALNDLSPARILAIRKSAVEEAHDHLRGV